MSGNHAEGQPLRISPPWMKWLFWLLMCVLTMGSLCALLGSVNEYATGPAVVRAEEQTDVTATLSGTVTFIMVENGERVIAGQPLVYFHAADEAAELGRISKEFEFHLIDTLRDPSNNVARQALAVLRTQKALAEARLGERIINAPRAGVVSDIRVRPAQHLSPGDVILSLIDDDPRFSLIVMVPGHYRPLLKPGMPLRLELSGYRYAYQQLVIEEVGDQVIGPGEARRILGQDVGDTIPLSGPIVLVRSRFSSPTFIADGRVYKYHSGLRGIAEVQVNSEPFIFTLLPMLKLLLQNKHG